MFNLVGNVQTRIKKALSNFQKTKDDLEKINSDIIEITINKEKLINEVRTEIDSLNMFKNQNQKIIEKINNFLQ